MNNFEEMAEYRDRCRPRIPGQLVVKLAEVAGQNTKEYSLLDVGSGTGNITEQFLPYFKDIIVVEPNPEFISMAKKRLIPEVPADGSVLFVNKEVEDAKFPPLWQASLVTLFKTFHKIDQERTLERLNNLVEAGGVLAILKDEDFWSQDTLWMKEVRQVVKSFLGEVDRFNIRQDDDAIHREALEKSPFSSIEEVRTPIRRTWSTNQILGFLYSTSFGAKNLFGDQVDEFEIILRQQLSKVSENDKFIETNEFTTTLARRP